MQPVPLSPRLTSKILVTKKLTFLLLLSSLGWISSAAAQDELLEREEKALQAAVEKASPSVVQLELVGGLESQEIGPISGLAVSSDGYVLTSSTMVRDSLTSILATTPSGKRAAAKIIAHDHSRNLTLLKVNTDESYPILPFVPREEITVGQWAIALGKTFSRNISNQSVGIISASNRIWGKAIQTDAKISPANYGGPLIDIHGRVFGVLTPLTPHPQGGQSDGTEWYDSGIGFAVPLADLEPHLEKLKAGENLHPGRIGVSLTSGNVYDLSLIHISEPTRPERIW